MSAFFPSDILKPFVHSFIITQSNTESTYTILPDVALVIGFQFKGRIAHVSNNQENPLSTAGITGLHDAPRIYKSESNTGTVLVRFRPGGAAQFFKTPVHELFRESLSLDNFMLRSELMLFEEQLNEGASDQERIEVVEKFLISRMTSKPTDQLVAAAVALIYKHNGNIRIGELAQQLNTSQSPLEKRFRAVVGASPKKFASIVRFRHTISKHDPNRPLTELGMDAGFYDQAHFIKEFKNLSGESPEAFFGR